MTLSLGLTSIVILLAFNYLLDPWFKSVGVQMSWRMPLVKSAPLVTILLGVVAVWGLGLDQQAGVKVVGSVPAGLPPVTWPLFDGTVWRALLPTALLISLVGYMESISVAKSLASRRRQKIDANQELIALGAANLGAAFSGGYPVNGGFSRSVVNFNAGANTGLASIITAGLVAVTALLLTPLFYYLPQAVLAAIIMVSVFSLINLSTLQHVWRYNKADALALLITFGAVLALGVELGIMTGVITTILLFLWRTSRPHVAIVGRLGQSETYRNILRHPVKTCPHVVAMRVDESLYFANTKFLEDYVLGIIAEQPQVKHLVLIGIAINFIDASALETLEMLLQELRSAGVEFHLADIKGPVMDRLKAIGFVDKIGPDHIHLSTHNAMQKLNCL
jgi:SulP family sulfate permease